MRASLILPCLLLGALLPLRAQQPWVNASSPTTQTLWGVALLELYSTGPAPVDAASPRVINFSVRTRAGAGPDTLITGFSVTGTNTRNILLRAVGPALAAFGVADFMPDPVLTLYREGLVIATNDNWALNHTIWLNLQEAFATVGAFPLPATATANSVSSSKDAALLISLAPGNYTAHASGKAGSTGVALVEVYEIP